MKATYKEDTVKIHFCLTSIFDELNEVVGKKLNSERNRFPIKYQDEGEEWILMRTRTWCMFWIILKLPGNNVARLSVIDIL